MASLFTDFLSSLSLINLGLAFSGVLAGIIIGALPGLSATMAVAILVPFTFALEPSSGLIVLGAIYTGAIFGGKLDGVNTSANRIEQMGPGKLIKSAGDSTYRRMATGSTMNIMADSIRCRLVDINFNNTVELNSTIYFCRANHNEFNYSANPTYLSSSQIRVKNTTSDNPVSYITTVGLYSSDNELMAVAKLSEPLKKDPNTELTLRVRLDY